MDAAAEIARKHPTDIMFLGPETNPQFNAVVGDFVSEFIWGAPGKFQMYGSMAVLSDETLIAGVVLHNWHPDEGVIELSGASLSPHWLTRRLLTELFDYVFFGLRCQLCVMRVSERNTRMLRIARAFGFSDYLIPRLRGRDEAEHVLTLTDDTWGQSKFRKAKLNG